MVLRPAYRPVRPELDDFLYAAVGEEIDGVPLSLISAYAQLGLDPREEAGRLMSLKKPEAIEQLGRMILTLTGTRWSPAEVRHIAAALVDRLPRAGQVQAPAEGLRPHAPTPPLRKTLWVVCLLLVAAVLVAVIAVGGSS